jgi:hypothetical protein
VTVASGVANVVEPVSRLLGPRQTITEPLYEVHELSARGVRRSRLRIGCLVSSTARSIAYRNLGVTGSMAAEDPFRTGGQEDSKSKPPTISFSSCVVLPMLSILPC